MRRIAILAASVFVGPIVAIIIARSLRSEALEQLPDAPLDGLCDAANRAADAGRMRLCTLLDQVGPLESLSYWLIGATALMALLYVAAAFGLARRREWLASAFPVIVRLCLAALVTVLLLQGLLLGAGAYELVIGGHAQRMIISLAALALGLVTAAGLIVVSWRKLLHAEPLRVSGLVVERAELPTLFARIEGIAGRLGAKPPGRLIVGLEPTAFVTTAEIDLAGTGRLPRLETLYLPATGLRALTTDELDAVIAHELGHFRGDDLRYSERFVPAYRGLALALDSVEIDEEGFGWFQLARLPALSLLSGMLYVLHRVVSGIDREREFAADRAAGEIGPGEAVIGALVKLSLLGHQWGEFRDGLGQYVASGRSRQNLVVDYLVRTSQLLRMADAAGVRESLLASSVPHPMDSHPPIAARARALGVDPARVLGTAVVSLASLRSSGTGLGALERRLSSLECSELALPGRSLTLDDAEELPPALSIALQAN